MKNPVARPNIQERVLNAGTAVHGFLISIGLFYFLQFALYLPAALAGAAAGLTVVSGQATAVFMRGKAINGAGAIFACAGGVFGALAFVHPVLVGLNGKAWAALNCVFAIIASCAGGIFLQTLPCGAKDAKSALAVKITVYAVLAVIFVPAAQGIGNAAGIPYLGFAVTGALLSVAGALCAAIGKGKILPEQEITQETLQEQSAQSQHSAKSAAAKETAHNRYKKRLSIMGLNSIKSVRPKEKSKGKLRARLERIFKSAQGRLVLSNALNGLNIISAYAFLPLMFYVYGDGKPLLALGYGALIAGGGLLGMLTASRVPKGKERPFYLEGYRYSLIASAIGFALVYVMHVYFDDMTAALPLVLSVCVAVIIGYAHGWENAAYRNLTDGKGGTAMVAVIAGAGIIIAGALFSLFGFSVDKVREINAFVKVGGRINSAEYAQIINLLFILLCSPAAIKLVSALLTVNYNKPYQDGENGNNGAKAIDAQEQIYKTQNKKRIRPRH